MLDRQIAVVYQPVDGGAGYVEAKVLEVLPLASAVSPRPSPLRLASALVRIDGELPVRVRHRTPAAWIELALQHA